MPRQKGRISAALAALPKTAAYPYPIPKTTTVPRLIIDKVIDGAFKEIEDTYRSRQPWNIPEVPQAKRKEAALAAKAYARKSFYDHRTDFTDERHIVNVIWHLIFASYFENLNRSGMQLHWYAGAANAVLSSRELSLGNIKWANELIRRAEDSYMLMKSAHEGNGDTHFDLQEDAKLIRGLSSLSASDIEQINAYIDLQISKYRTSRIDDRLLNMRVSNELKGLLLVAKGNEGKFDVASTKLFVAAQELDRVGAKEWAKELIEQVKKVHNLYLLFRQARNDDPYAQERRYILSDTNAAKSRIDNLAEKVGRKDPSEALKKGRDAFARLRRGLGRYD